MTMHHKPKTADWEKFTQQNMALAGAEYDPANTETKRHIQITDIIAQASRFVDPRLVNGVLVGSPAGELRQGVQWHLRGKVPESSAVPLLLDQWVQNVEEGIARLKQENEEARANFAWSMHDYLCCMNPFKEANGRTARIMLNHIRLLTGLDLYVLQYDKADGYYERLHTYRNEVYVPYLLNNTM